MDRSKKDKLLEELSFFEEEEKSSSMESYSLFSKTEILKFHFMNLKNMCNKKKLLAIWVKKRLETSYQTQNFIQETLEATQKLKEFEKKLRKNFDCVLSDPNSNDDIETMITGDKKKGLEDALKILREFIYSGLEKYFLNEGKAFFSNELNQKNEANFLKSNHIIINMMLEMLACNDLIENEIEELYSKKYYLKIYIQNYSQEILEQLQTSFENIIQESQISPLFHYYKFIKRALESLESIEYFLLEAIDQSKFFEMEESKTILQNEDKKKSISLHLKKIENGFNIHGKAFILNSNGESPLLQNSSNKEIGPKKSDYLFKFPFSRTASINSFKYYEENRSDVAFRESFSPGDKKKNIEKKTEVVEKKKIKNFQTCDFFRCGFF